MNKLRTLVKKSFITLTVLTQIFGYSYVSFSRVALAEEVVAGCATTNGAQAPTGSASYTFIFDSNTCTWENDYYSWDPVTKITTPKYSRMAIYNPDTNAWETPDWVFVPAQAKYVLTIISTPATLAEQIAQGDGPAASAAQVPASDTAGQFGSSTINSGNGTDSTNSINGSNNANLAGNYINNISVFTTLDSNANSGNANALQNTTVGNVATGDATAIANILNMIQSSWNPSMGDVTLFSADLYRNYVGDLLFDPSIALGNGTGSNNSIDNNTDQTLAINVEENADIQNDINLNATSGNANANGNTTVGDVSTGDATAIANVINMINSMIAADQSFIGSLNLHGDLNGDILLPRSLMEVLLGNGTNSTNTISGDNNLNVDADYQNNNSITNTTNLTAVSGNATANDNTTVGNLSTGNADTNVNEMNLVGQNVQGTKGLLVFVNVMGSWVGMLFGNPGTSTIVGGNGSNSINTINNNTDTDVDIDVTRDLNITNNLNLNATSGNATANANTTVGNVTSGNASSGVNLLNMIDSNINFSDWFGVLFINVFGTWNGSFGVDTAAGNQGGGMGGGGATSNQPAANPTVASAQTFSFVPRQVAAATTGTAAPAQVLANNEEPETTKENAKPNVAAAESVNRANFWWSVGGIMVAISLLGVERFLTFRRR